MWPASFWEKVYEPLIRRAAGLGRAALEADPDHYEKGYAHCDVLVIGAGPAGLAAALAAGRSGARVDSRRGGLRARRPTALGAPDDRRAARGRMGRAGDRRTALAAGRAADAAHDGVRRFDDGGTARWSAWPITCPSRRRTSRASASGGSSRSGRCWRPAPSNGRSCSAATTGPVSCWRARCAPTSIASPWCRAGAPSCSPTATTAGARRGPRRGWRAGRGDRRLARTGHRAELARRFPDIQVIAGEVMARAVARHVESVEVTSASGKTDASTAIWSRCPVAGTRRCI